MAKPLKGIKVLDFTRLLPGPVCTMLLADLGAEVIKIEDPKMGDAARYVHPKLKNNSQVFCHLNRGKKSLAMDLQNPESISIIYELIKTHDVVFESFRPGVMNRLGLDYKKVKKINPKIVYCSLTGFGQTGPYKDMPGHDINYLGYAGVLDQTGYKGEPPALSNFQIADLAGGSMMAAMSILAGYIQAQSTGIGSYLDVAMLDGVLTLSPIALGTYALGKKTKENLSRSEGFLNGGTPCYKVYKTKDNRYMALGTIEKKFWDHFLAVIKRPDLSKYHMVMGKKALPLEKTLIKIFKQKTQKQWLKLLANHETCCTPVLRFEETLKNEQVLARNIMRTEIHPLEGEVLHLGFPVQINGKILRRSKPAPQLGEHTEEILKSLTRNFVGTRPPHRL